MNSSEANSTWSVKWDRNTTTEGGSSGSPLFDENKRIIGQLWGGGASCNNLTATDFYGRLSNSWLPSGSDSSKQLKYWLDPSNTGAQFINGLDPVNPITANFDGQLSNPTGVKGINCTDTIYPAFRLSNIGTTTITSLPIQFNFDGEIKTSFSKFGDMPDTYGKLMSTVRILENNRFLVYGYKGFLVYDMEGNLVSITKYPDFKTPNRSKIAMGHGMGKIENCFFYMNPNGAAERVESMKDLKLLSYLCPEEGAIEEIISFPDESLFLNGSLRYFSRFRS
jgi:hypothetical protein